MGRTFAKGLPLLVLTLCLPGPASAASQTKDFDQANPVNPPGAIYWCPDRPPDSQYVSTPQPGCKPLIEEEKDAAKAERRAAKRDTPPKERPTLTTRDIQGQVAAFLQQYRDFMNCCAATARLEEVEDLEEQATYILKFVQQSGFVNMGTAWRGMTLSQIIPPVAQAREDLRKLSTRLRRLDEAYDRVDNVLDYEAAARERRRIQEEEAAIQKDSRRLPPPSSAPTGTDIGGPGSTQGPPASTLPNRFGTSIENTTSPTTLPSATGADIGSVVSPDSKYQQGSLRPRAGAASGASTLPSHVGTTPTEDTTLSNSTGFEVGAPQGPTGSSTLPSRAGPSIGESSLNRR